MRKAVAVAILAFLVVAASIGGVADAQGPIEPFPTGLTADTMASQLTVSAICSEDGTGALAIFRWRPPIAAGTQWLDLSIYDNGFAPGTFLGIGPFDSSVGKTPVLHLLPGVTHYWRINFNYVTGDFVNGNFVNKHMVWFPSATASLTSPPCP